MDSIEFLNFSKKLNASASNTEIEYRQIVGRSYYCAFHQVREKALSLGIPVDSYKGGTHSSLQKTLISLRPANNKLKGIAFKLNNFHIKRVEADYKLDVSVTETSANEAIQMCEKIISDLKGVGNL